MRVSDWLDVAARGLFAAICLVTALYGLFAYVPFTYTQIIQARVVDGLYQFALWHHWLMVLATLLLAWSLRRAVLSADPSAIVLLLLFTLATGFVLTHAVLPALANDRGGLVVAALALVPPVWLAIQDFLEEWRHLRWLDTPGDDEGRLAKAAGGAMLFTIALFAGLWWLRVPADFARPREVAVAMAWSGAVHLFVCAVAIAALGLVRGVVRACRGAARAEFVGIAVVLMAVLAAMVRSVVFTSMAFTGPFATLAAIGVAVALVFGAAASVALVAARRHQRLATGLELWCAPGARPPSRLRLALTLVVVALVALVIERRAAAMDWNFLLQKLAAVLVWVAAFVACYGAVRATSRIGWRWPLGAAALAPVILAAMAVWGDRTVADAQAAVNPSFRLLRDGLLASDVGASTGFYKYLAANTNIPRERRVDPVSLDFVDAFTTPAAQPRPDVYVIVVDSLRRDYVTPYNPAVTFTPAIDALAKDSDVFTHAFTRYGATGLSEPSIWAGGMLVHKQYVTPFAPMNTLDKLLEAEQYQQFVSVDSILRTLLPASPRRVELDVNIPNKDYDLCRSLDELQGRLSGLPDSAGPVFAYTQPQNIHISAIAREGASSPEGEHYPGFYDPYATRLRRIDACLGTFVDYLKTTGRYERSVIVFTSDHGDSLGEDGRFGHAYTIYPEIMRIPLIVHVPPSLRAGFDAQTDDLAFSVDITPSLYALLGHTPTRTSPLTGRSLYAPRGSTPPSPRRDLMVVSSYGAVYGLIGPGGRHLYIVDSINFEEHAYEMGEGLGSRAVPVTPGDRVNGQAAIRDQVGALARLYRFDPGVP